MESVPTPQPLGGGFGAAQTRSYTFFMIVGVQGGLMWFTHKDLGAEGARNFAKAVGIESNVWVWVILILAYFLCNIAVSIVSYTFTRYTGTVYTENRIGFALSGGPDVSGWSSLLSYAFTLYVFAYVLPANLLGIFRPVAFILISVFLSWLVAGNLANRVFKTLYGPPRYTMSDIR